MTEGLYRKVSTSTLFGCKYRRQWWNGFLVGFIFCFICQTIIRDLTLTKEIGLPEGEGDNPSLLFDTGNIIKLPEPLVETQTQVDLSLNYSTSASAATISTTTIKGLQIQSHKTQKQHQRFAIAIYVELREHLYGLYSIVRKVHQVGMIAQGIDIVVIATDQWATDINEEGTIIKTWLKEGLIQNIIFQDHNYFIQKINGTGLWPGVFNKLVFFNLTDYDKVIGFDTDILIRKNIYHWFTDFDTPCAIQPKGLLEWNSGAMIIEPSSEDFDALVNKLPDVRVNDRNKIPNLTEPDEWNNGYGHQGFLSSYFTISDDPKHRMKTMGKENSILSSELTNNNALDYFWFRRNHIFQTIHLTYHKPWDFKPTGGNRWRSRIACEVLEEFRGSIIGMEKYDLSITAPYLMECINSTTPPDITNSITTTATTAAKVKTRRQKKKEKRTRNEK